ncbi:Tyrosine recombinase XerD (plasmid) [Dolichospermum sp. UHCC 0315A]|uniref:tyrosine-type recombinase/integrase n=2 Tax=Dolichospermum sp. UHCC 0315A TaxID=1914871 RepID=UPI0011E82CA1|nr:tyrosine-type recombinase/integrase [Dolichospermum sp. UHCC 0315A]QEI41458.1 Tyrosine recombinase XerD [Dolichospermum sp. UHCC 0315A]QEI42137.1 Tyrosine recombinase XerD [Dolichospermum sp. UHCC 0315A]QEI44189.1 Tyrosine recombinase XerD [Dolichospermum sp. UHCC 0315A]QEI44207.1 Tyrosine recombinase XerD [Dolichospermum sp. UHCC 0315A]QEI44255.1 Tyrosine recombinase XerD [Dolichospermum sp. UHCC 0315A]
MKQAVTLATVAVKFLERTGLAPSTIKTYELTLLNFLAEYGSWLIEIISKQTLIEYLDSLSHLKYTTHHKHQAILQSLFNFAVQQEYIKINPIQGLKQRPPQREKGEHKSDTLIRYLTPDQLNILYTATKDDLRLSAIIHLLHRTGCRIGELLALNLSDLDIKNQKFQVLGKGNKQRWCFYSNDAAQSLNKYFQHTRHKNINALFTAQHPVTLKVSRISYHTLHDYWREITNTNPELTGVRIHDLRHTYATERVGLISIEELRSLMGHESIQTTLRYQKVTSQKAESAARHALNMLINPELQS